MLRNQPVGLQRPYWIELQVQPMRGGPPSDQQCISTVNANGAFRVEPDTIRRDK